MKQGNQKIKKLPTLISNKQIYRSIFLSIIYNLLALNNNIWRSGRILFNIHVICPSKPKSNIRSALKKYDMRRTKTIGYATYSSSTTIVQRRKLVALSFTNSINRPGVAMTISGDSFNDFVISYLPAPP